MNVIRGNVGKLIAEAFVTLSSQTKNHLLPLMMYWGGSKARGHYVYG